MDLCLRCVVSGRVQGVFFRASARQKANDLDITGVARNLPDGRVEVIACGDQKALREFQNWLWVGPRHASVANVDVEKIESQTFNSFTVE